MENFELIEKYIAGQLDGAEKEAFEQHLQANPSLQTDLAIQKHVIEGIKKARITELKAMLNQVPVGAIHVGASIGKIVIGTIAVGTMVTGSLLYFKPWVKTVPPVIKSETPLAENKVDIPVKPVETIIAEPKESKPAPAKADPKTKKEVVSPPKSNTVRPKIEVTDPTDELTPSAVNSADKAEGNRTTVKASHIVVETNAADPKYSFHYQFNQGKLILYGNFDKGLYEILEVHGDTNSVFLFYKGSYYALGEKQTSITPLVAIRNAQLILKLKDYRSR